MMKKMLVLLFGIFTTSLVNSQNLVDSLGRKQGDWVYSASFDSITKESNVIISCKYENDQLNGIYRVFDEREKLRYEVNFIRDKRNGGAYYYNKKFGISRILFFNENELVGIIIFDSHQRIVESKGYQNEMDSGINVLFFKSGKAMRRSLFKNGKLDGEEIVHKKNGNVDAIFEYLNNKLVKVR